MIYKVIDITEHDYGCEGVMDNDSLLADVFLEDENGNILIKAFDDNRLYAENIEVGSTVKIEGKHLVLY